MEEEQHARQSGLIRNAAQENLK